MECFSVDPQKKEIQAIDIQMQANSVYTFFSSILIDELPSIKEHVIYADANALSEKKTPYFIGEQLVLGNALIVGIDEMMAEKDVTIPQDALKAIINYEVPTFYKDVLELLSKTDVNLYRTFKVEHNSQNMDLNISWVLYFFNIADEKTKEYFITNLSQTIDEKKDVVEFMQKMAKAALRAAT